MKKVKRSLVFLLVGALLFSFITVLTSADVAIPQGPIDSENRENGINQIMQAGVEDINFASAIYDAFAKDNFFGDETKNVREILGEYSGNIDASSRGIKSIDGIMWLRNAKSINLNNDYESSSQNLLNQISDLTPLSVEHIVDTANLASEVEAKTWFKQRRNLKIDLTGNPIKKYSHLAGQLDILFTSEYLSIIETEPLNAIKRCATCAAADWSVSKNIELPKIEKDGKDVKFTDKIINGEYSTRIVWNAATTINEDANINYSQLKNDTLEIANIKHSGSLLARAGIDLSDGIAFFKNTILIGDTDSTDPDSVTFAYQTIFSARIYTPVVAEKDVKTNIKVTKSATCDYSGKKVVGAKYYLYDAKTNERVSDKEYITDQNGEFWIDDTLAVGEYYLLEFEAPEGFLLNESKISFSIVADQREISVSGGDKNLDINAGDIKEDPDTVYIDRYSNNVEVNITDDPNYTLDHIELAYFDCSTETYVPFKEDIFTVQEAANWINTNKGNAKTPGIINDEIKITAFFVHHKELVTSDPRPVTNVEFTKYGSGLDDTGDVVQTPLAGATFKLECTHKHTDHCKGADGSYSQCTDPHTDFGDYLSDEGCSWSSEVVSDENGRVFFENVNTGTYKMTETVVPDGYLLPETTWTVVVDAAKETFTIEADENDSNSIIENDQDKGYTIVNESFNVKVKKIDSETKEVLKGASFEIFKLDDEKQWVSVATATTNDDGFAYFEKLTDGQYMIREIEAPPGYELITDVIEFKVPFEYTSTDKNGIESDFTSDTKTVTFTISDKVGVVLPNTGATLTARIVTLGIVIMGIMVILLKKIKNENNLEMRNKNYEER